MSYNWAAYDAANSCVRMPQGMTNLMAYMLRRFAYLRSMGICHCRLIGGSTTRSHHSECRAGDIGIPTGAGGSFRPELGNPIIELLGPNGKALGLDHLIMNRRIYSARSPDGRYYSGPHPHYDHAHTGIHTVQAKTLTMAKIVSILGSVGPGIPLPPGDDEDMEKYIKAQQVNLNKAGYKGANGKVLTVDGLYGANTQFAEAARDMDAATGGQEFDSISVLRRVKA